MFESKLAQEVKQHAVFCREKCRLFHGRSQVLKVADSPWRHYIDVNIGLWRHYMDVDSV